MSTYYCGLCEGLKDADYSGCNEHPDDECECICDACYESMPEECMTMEDYEE